MQIFSLNEHFLYILTFSFVTVVAKATSQEREVRKCMIINALVHDTKSNQALLSSVSVVLPFQISAAPAIEVQLLIGSSAYLLLRIFGAAFIRAKMV